jgi:hypothetical protein
MTRESWLRAALVACVASGIPMLFVMSHPIHAAAAWGALILLYFGLLRLFGSRFMIEGAVVITARSIISAIAVHAAHIVTARTTVQPFPAAQPR